METMETVKPIPYREESHLKRAQWILEVSEEAEETGNEPKCLGTVALCLLTGVGALMFLDGGRHRWHALGFSFVVGLVMKLIIGAMGGNLEKDQRRWREHAKQIQVGEISDDLMRATDGQAYTCRLLLRMRAFNRLAGQVNRRGRAWALGLQERPENWEEIVSRMAAVRTQLVAESEMIRLRNEVRQAELEEGGSHDALLEGLELADVRERTRVALDETKIPDQDPLMREGLAEIERDLAEHR